MKGTITFILVIFVIGTLIIGLNARRRMEDLKRDIEIHRQKLDALSYKFKNMSEEAGDLTVMTEEFQTFINELSSPKETIPGLPQKERKVKGTTKLASTSIETIEKEIAQWLESWLKSVETKLKEKEKSLAALRRTNEKLQKDYEILDGQLGELNKGNDHLKKEMEDLRKNKDKLAEEIAKVTEEKNTSKNETQQLKTTFEEKMALIEGRLEQEKQSREEFQGKLEENQKVREKEQIDMHYKLALLYDRFNCYRDAEREYLRILSIDPNHPRAYYGLGVLYDKNLDSLDKAIYHYRQYMKLSPQTEDAHKVKKWLLELEKRKKGTDK